MTFLEFELGALNVIVHRGCKTNALTGSRPGRDELDVTNSFVYFGPVP